jgi:hypothetical protein
MSPVDSYIENIDPKLRNLARKVWGIGRKTLPKRDEKIWMGVPTFFIDGKGFASIADYSKHLNLYFFQGARLSSKLLEGTGKGMRHVKIESSKDIDEKEIARLFKEASKLLSSSLHDYLSDLPHR